MASFEKRYNAPGTPPGTLRAVSSTTLPEILVIDYARASISERTILNIVECATVHDTSQVTWIHVQGAPTSELLASFNESLGLHMLALEDIANIGQRPKLDEFEDHLFAILNLQSMNEQNELFNEQVSIFTSGSYVVSFCAGAREIFDPIRTRLRTPTSRLRTNGPSYLFQALIDLIVDRGFPLLEQVENEIEAVEERVLQGEYEEVLPRLHSIRRNLLTLRKNLWPQRELLSQLVDYKFEAAAERINPYLRDCYDHTVQMIDLVETYREIVASIFEMHISNNSNRLNETMRVLTVIATIFIPLTFIAGVYGMNFGGQNPGAWAMPELRWAYGYPAVWLVMLGMAAGMLYLFRRKNWI